MSNIQKVLVRPDHQKLGDFLCFALYSANLSIGKAYKPSILSADKEGVYRAKVDKPAKGWTAYFIEMTFEGPDDTHFKFTTGVQVAPDILPHSYQDFLKSLKNP